MKTYIFVFSLLTLFITSAFASSITYFSCKVEEPTDTGKNITVTVKFAIKNLDIYEKQGELIQYPGIAKEDEEFGTILVTPRTYGKKQRYTKMWNLNGQGGDLRFEGRNIKLWGDGDGYQFTDLIIWDVNSESDVLEGYVRDYGPAYGDEEIFKQFIKCQRSNKRL